MAKKLLQQMSQRRRAFTLIELLVVVLILAILMAIAMPLYLNAAAESERRTCRSNMQTVATANQAYKINSAGHLYTDKFSDLKDLPNTPICPSAGAYTIKLDEPSAGVFTVHCSRAPHDDNGTGGTGYSPGRDGQ